MKPFKLTAASAALLLLLSGCTPSAPADPAASETASEHIASASESTPESVSEFMPETASENTGASSETPETASADSAQPEATAVSQIAPQPYADPSGMALYSSLSFFAGEDEWELQTFVPEGSLDGQTLMLDDSCHFHIRAVCGENTYVFLDEQIQLGVPEADVWTDDQNRLHIVIRDVRSARFRITDYVYDPTKNCFVGTALIAEDGVNFWGTLR